MGRKLVLIGGGGHCKSVLDCLLSLHSYDDIGISDFRGEAVLGIPVVGTDDDLPRLFQNGWTDAFITVGSVGDTKLRKKLYELVKGIGFTIPTIADPTACIAREVELREGCFVGKNAVINAGSTIGCCSIVNTGAIVEHDCSIGDFSHVSSGAVLCGQVKIGHNSHVGAGTVVRQQIRIGDAAMIGAGSVVVQNIPDSVLAYGNPCRVVDK